MRGQREFLFTQKYRERIFINGTLIGEWCLKKAGFRTRENPGKVCQK
jgi:hypothetical protein